MPEIKIDFYTVHFSDKSAPSLESLLEDLNRRRRGGRSVPVPGGWLYFYSLQPQKSYLNGIVLRVKSDEIPPAADQRGRLVDLQLDRRQGIAGVTHFYYRPSNGVFLLHRNAQGVRAPSFERFVMQTTQVDIELRPVINPEALRRLRRFQTIRKMTVKVANPGPAFHRRAGRSLRSILDLMNEYEAPVAEVVLGVGRSRRGSLNAEHAKAFLERLFRLGEQGGHVEKIIAHGKRHEEERTLLLDLLRDKMVHAAEVPVGPNRRLSDRGSARALEDAYEQRREELEDLFGR